jgi:molybdopterin converting factor small subunit
LQPTRITDTVTLFSTAGKGEETLIRVEFMGFPMVEERLGKKSVETDVRHGTLRDVIECLIREHGKTMKETFYREDDRLDPIIQVSLNGASFLLADHMDRPVREGDSVAFMLMLAGG